MKYPDQMKILFRVEKFYGLPFSEAIQLQHWKLMKSMNQIAQETGLIRQSLMHACKVRGIQLRTIKEHFDLIGAPTGKDHWAWGKTKETSSAYLAHSRQMKTNNPSIRNSSLIKRAKTISKTYRKKPWRQEKVMKAILKKLHIAFKSQYPVDRYVADFYLPKLNLIIEVDSKESWGVERLKAARKRDLKLKQLGFKTLRFCKTKLEKDGFIDQFKAILSTYESRKFDIPNAH